MGIYRITPQVGILHIYINGEHYKSKRHESRFNREMYCNSVIYSHGDKILKFVFNDGLQEIVMYEHDFKKIKASRVHEIPSYFKDGIEYFDDAKFCKWYNMPDAIPNKLILNPIKL